MTARLDITEIHESDIITDIGNEMLVVRPKKTTIMISRVIAVLLYIKYLNYQLFMRLSYPELGISRQGYHQYTQKSPLQRETDFKVVTVTVTVLVKSY